MTPRRSGIQSPLATMSIHIGPSLSGRATYLEAVLPELIRCLSVLALVLRVAAKLKEEGHDRVQVSPKTVADGSADRPDSLTKHEGDAPRNKKKQRKKKVQKNERTRGQNDKTSEKERWAKHGRRSNKGQTSPACMGVLLACTWFERHHLNRTHSSRA